MFPLPSSILSSVCDPVVEMQRLSEFNMKAFAGIECFSIHTDPCITIIKSVVTVPLDSVSHSKKL